MYYYLEENCLIGKGENEIIKVEAWGKNALRVRASMYPILKEENNALTEKVNYKANIEIKEEEAIITNGRIKAVLSSFGEIYFYKDNKLILQEYNRGFGSKTKHSKCLKIKAREYKPLFGGPYEINLRFEANKKEKLFGMGQYQQDNLDLKGCILELAQRNSQISIPFALSNLGYGFLWNNPSIGTATFGANYTEWNSKVSKQIDYWITVDETPKNIIENYTEVTGRSPMMPDNVMGLWQSKLRYRTQEEVLEVAREYYNRGIPLDVIVIDFFHWIRQGDWSFDPEYWPDPKAMVKELNDMGTRCMVSIWPTVDKESINFEEMKNKGLLIRTERGSSQTFDFLGDTRIYDATNPEAREFIWSKTKENYFDSGIDLFWLDQAEPEYIAYDYDNYRYYLGPTLEVGNIYPKLHAKAFFDGLKKEGVKDCINLVRCAWVGSQKYATLVWSGDINGNFETLRDQLAAGLNIGMAGIPWWASDIGGFFANIKDKHFKELMIRWFQFATFCPVLRMHGDREPHTIPPLDDKKFGGGFCFTGEPNEIWSFGEDVYKILAKYVQVRLELKPYIKEVMKEAHETGAPVIRTMFFEFPNDKLCWDIDDQYMFGSDYLVAPILYEGLVERSVYLPKGKWREMNSSNIFEGEQRINVKAPLDTIPVFIKVK